MALRSGRDPLVTARRRRLRQAVALAIGAVVTVCAAVTLVDALRQVSRPFPGVLVAANGFVSQFELPDWPGAEAGLRFGDRVVRANGGRAVWLRARRLPVGTPVRYRVSRMSWYEGPARLHPTIATRTFTVADFLAVFTPLWGTGVLVIVSGLILFALGPDDPASGVFLLFCVSLGLMLVTAFDYYSTYRFTRLSPLVSTASFGALLHFNFLLAARVGPARRPRFPALLYLPSLIIASGLETTMFTSARAFAMFRTSGFVSATIAFLTFTVTQFAMASRTRSASARRQVTLQGIGIGLVGSVPIIASTASAFGVPGIPIGLVVPLGAGFAIIAPYSISCLLREEHVARFLFRERYARGEAVRALGERLVTAKSIDDIAGAVEDGLRSALGCRSRLVLCVEDAGARLPFNGHARSDAEVRRIIAERARSLCVRVEAIAVECHGSLLGALDVDPKADGRPFMEEEIGLLADFVNQIALALDRALAFARLAQVNGHLEERVEARTAALEMKNRALHELNQELELYSRALSHDLRSPLTAATSALSMARETRGVPPVAARLVGMGDEAVHRALDMVDGMLALTRTVQKPEPFEAVEIGSVVRELVTELRPALLHGRITIEIAGDLPIVSAQREKLGHVVRNVLANAIKYVAHADTPRIVVGVAATTRGRAFYVQDNGVGIPRRYHRRIFQLFHRVPATESIPSPGGGIGLALAKQIMDLHGGDIWVESDPGGGATFFMTFPDLQPRDDGDAPAVEVRVGHG